MNTPTIVLTIAGSDSSGGAGIQADIKAISALGSFAASVITAVTAQNTLGVQGIHPIPTDMVTQQIRSVMDDLHPDAVKIGMVCDKGIASTIAACLDEYRPRWVVFDPVMVSTSGHKLMTDDIIETICRELLPKASLITPNLHEARIFLGHDVKDIEAMEEGAETLAKAYGCSVLIKGGHLEGGGMCDVLYDLSSQSLHHFDAPKIESRNLHGTGCTLSSAIATKLSQGLSLPDAIREAKAYVTRAIDAAKDMHIGNGHGPLWHFL
ncbi:MAG: bifunctional hydroxymethylpyrimidine kinase/phosphomethylpyrimidine kinase [Bacteroides sp.]|nr:bifunctional hydroxymethylpyrimidine kinase/phosphomethylpyrimidine kinase [Bacteroides sp.]